MTRVAKRAETVVTWKCGYAGVRVGEAAHPGPPTMQDQVQQLQAQLQQQQWDLTGQQAGIHSLRAQLDSQQLQWYVEHSTKCRCSVCMMQLQLNRINSIDSSIRKSKDNKQQVIVLPTPRARSRGNHNDSDSTGSNHESASDSIGGSGSELNDSDSDNNGSDDVSNDMLWTLFDQPRRKRGLRPSQRRIRDHALAGSQQRIRGREQMGPRVRFRHNSSDDRHNSSDDMHSNSSGEFNNDGHRQNSSNYRHNNRPPTHQHSRSNNLPTVSQQMQLELISTEKQLRDTAVSLEEKQTVKALRRALNTVRVVAKGLAQKQWQMRSQMHRGLRAGGLSNSGAVLRQ